VRITNPTTEYGHPRGGDMKRPEFECIFKEELNTYLDAKVAAGFQERSFTIRLRAFDVFCKNRALNVPVFPRELADEWCKRRANEATTTHYSRVNSIKHFLNYLQNQGYDVYITRDIAFKKTQFQPRIYSEDETRRYFQAVDAY
jgi:hypothetical protein